MLGRESMIGTTIGNYVVRAKLGEGGMGAVYLAEHARLGRRVAVKVLLPHLGGSPDVVARFFNEAKAATEIKNEHIVDVLDFGELPDGASYIVMEWLEGQSLADLLKREGRVPIGRAAHIARGLGEALGAAHARGIVHRDLKPDNVFLVTRSGDPDFVKVLDFGIAKLAPANAGDVRTQTGAMMGTPLYMSPEQINGANVDHRTDVYAMGIILYQMLAGTLPFETTTLTELLLAHATRTPAPLRTRDPSIPATMESAVSRALEKDPARRFDSVEDLARAFSGEASEPRPQLAPAPVSSLATTGIAPAVTVAPTRSLAPVLLGGAGLLAAAGIVLAIVLRPGSHPAPAAPAAAESSVAASAAPPLAEVTASAVVPASATRAAPPSTDRWVLATTDCPPGAMPKSVVTTHTGNEIVSRAPGFPDSTGVASANGSFRVHNAVGSCTGHATARVVTETCTNELHASCHATYNRSD